MEMSFYQHHGLIRPGQHLQYHPPGPPLTAPHLHTPTAPHLHTPTAPRPHLHTPTAPHFHAPTAPHRQPQYPQLTDPRLEPRFHLPWQYSSSFPVEGTSFLFSLPPMSGGQSYPHQLPSPGIGGGGPPPLMMAPGVASPGLLGTGVSVAVPEPMDPFIADWLHRVGERRSKVTETTQRSLTIPEARLLLSRAVYLVTSLRSLHASLSMVSAEDQSTWDGMWREVYQCKSELEVVRGQLSQPGVWEGLSRRVERTAAKRERARRAKCEREADKKERMTQAEERTDKLLRERRQKELKLKTEASVAASARSVLEGVKRKQTEVKQFQDLLSSLNQLREHRKEFRKKGEILPPDTDETYTQNYHTLENLLGQQIREYESEEHTLRVLMEEEVREKMSSQQKQSAEVAAPTPLEIPCPLPLMGVPLSLADSAHWHKEYWFQAERSEELRDVVRQRWSCFEHPEGSPIVTEEETSAPSVCDPAWKQFIV